MPVVYEGSVIWEKSGFFGVSLRDHSQGERCWAAGGKVGGNRLEYMLYGRNPYRRLGARSLIITLQQRVGQVFREVRAAESTQPYGIVDAKLGYFSEAGDFSSPFGEIAASKKTAKSL